MKINWKRVFFGVNADRLPKEEQELIEWADALLTEEQRYEKKLAEAWGVPRHFIAERPTYNSTDSFKALQVWVEAMYRDVYKRVLNADSHS